MAQQLTIPGGKSKGTPLSQADAKDIQYWLTRIGGALEENPQKQYADRDRVWLAAAKAELAGRNGSKPATNGSAPANGAAKPAPAPAASTSMAIRDADKLAGSYSDANGAANALREAMGQFNLVSPATSCGMLPEGTGIALSFVYVDITKVGNKFPAKEVFGLPGGDLGLSATTLKKIASAAGIEWDPVLSGRLDDGRTPRYAAFRAVGYVKNFDGSPRTITGEKVLDLRGRDAGDAADSPQLSAMRDRAGESANFDAQIRDMRLFLNEHVETKAKSRAIADMGIKRSYTPEELSKPFAVARLMWTGQTKDPELKRIFAEKQFDAMHGATKALYSQQNTSAPVLPAQSGYSAPPIGSVPAESDDRPVTYTVASEPAAEDYDTSPADPSKASAPAGGDAAPSPASPPAGQPTTENAGEKLAPDGGPDRKY